jgi:hypothetical protein
VLYVAVECACQDLRQLSIDFMVDLPIFQQRFCNVHPLALSICLGGYTCAWQAIRVKSHRAALLLRALHVFEVNLELEYSSFRFLSCSATILAARTLLRHRVFDFQLVFVPSSIPLRVPQIEHGSAQSPRTSSAEPNYNFFSRELQGAYMSNSMTVFNLFPCRLLQYAFPPQGGC